jgi:hypothetical protein
VQTCITLHRHKYDEVESQSILLYLNLLSLSLSLCVCVSPALCNHGLVLQISPGEHVGMIPLNDSQVVPSQNSKEFAFQIVTRIRVFFLRAESEDEMRQWCAAIERCKSSSSTDGSTGSSLSLTGSTSLSQVRPEIAYPGSEKKGWLNKKGKSNRIWRQRWFVLEDNLLSYYKTLQVCSTSARNYDKIHVY